MVRYFFEMGRNIYLYIAKIEIAAVLLVYQHYGHIIFLQHPFYDACLRQIWATVDFKPVIHEAR